MYNAASLFQQLLYPTTTITTTTTTTAAAAATAADFLVDYSLESGVYVVIKLQGFNS